tara:strand:+ start:8135 stop:8350 length:216 start_codon:yes stop_codon:yes gene_type:complete
MTDNQFNYSEYLDLDKILNLHNELKSDYLYQGLLNTSKVEKFTEIILNNIILYKEENFDSDENEDNLYNDI